MNNEDFVMIFDLVTKQMFSVHKNLTLSDH